MIPATEINHLILIDICYVTNCVIIIKIILIIIIKTIIPIKSNLIVCETTDCDYFIYQIIVVDRLID